MEFEWDEDKRRSNAEKHGIDFEEAAEIFGGRTTITMKSNQLGGAAPADRWAKARRHHNGDMDLARARDQNHLGKARTQERDRAAGAGAVSSWSEVNRS